MELAGCGIDNIVFVSGTFSEGGTAKEQAIAGLQNMDSFWVLDEIEIFGGRPRWVFIAKGDQVEVLLSCADEEGGDLGVWVVEGVEITVFGAGDEREPTLGDAF